MPLTSKTDGFVGDCVGFFTTREGDRGVVLQHVDCKVLGSYLEKQIANRDDMPERPVSHEECGRLRAILSDYSTDNHTLGWMVGELMEAFSYYKGKDKLPDETPIASGLKGKVLLTLKTYRTLLPHYENYRNRELERRDRWTAFNEEKKRLEQARKEQERSR